MKIDNKSKTNRTKQSKKEKSSSGVMKIFYIFMLLLVASGSLIRIANARQRTPRAVETPVPESSPAGAIGTATRIFVYHREGNGLGECKVLTVTARGDAIFSNCGNGVEKQVVLSASEQAKLQGWIERFQPVNYEHTDEAQAGKGTTRLYLNGQGSQPASASEVQTMLDFAETLAAKISAQP